MKNIESILFLKKDQVWMQNAYIQISILIN